MFSNFPKQESHCHLLLPLFHIHYYLYLFPAFKSIYSSYLVGYFKFLQIFYLNIKKIPQKDSSLLVSYSKSLVLINDSQFSLSLRLKISLFLDSIILFLIGSQLPRFTLYPVGSPILGAPPRRQEQQSKVEAGVWKQE